MIVAVVFGAQMPFSSVRTIRSGVYGAARSSVTIAMSFRWSGPL